jgi:hypothetical protein
MAARAKENYNSKTFSNQGRESLMKSINGQPILHSYIHLAYFCRWDSINWSTQPMAYCFHDMYTMIMLLKPCLEMQ